MRPVLLVASVALLGLPTRGQAPVPDPPDLAAAFDALEAADSDVRRGAEAWLARHLDASDLPEVAEALRTRGAEVAGRLQSALGSDDRMIGLAAGAAAQPEPRVRAVGEEALRRRVVDWLGTDELFPASFAWLMTSPDPRPVRLRRLEVAGSSLTALVERLDRAVAREADTGIAGVALDPRLPGESLRLVPQRGSAVRTVGVQGDTVDLIGALAAGFDLEVDVFGARGGTPWLLLRSSDVPARPCDAVVTDWVRAFATGLDRVERRRVARALAASGWPGAVSWFEERWRETGDRAAFHGLVAAAGRGHVAPSLLGAAGHAELVRALDAEVSAAEGERLVHAARGAGPAGADGADLRAALAAGWDDLAPAALARRLDVLAEIGGAPPREAQRLRDALAGGAPLPRACRWPAVLALAGDRPVAFEVADGRALLEAARRAERDELAVLLALQRAGATPPAAWREAGDVVREDRPLAACWWVLAGDEAAAAGLVARALERSDRASAVELEVGDLLRRLARTGRAPAVRDTLARAFPGASEVRALRLGALAEVLDGAERARLLERTPRPESRADWVVLGALAGAADGETADGETADGETADGETAGGETAARARLFERAAEAVQRDGSAAAPWAAGVERAFQAALARDDAPAARELERSIGVLLRAADDGLAERFRRGEWPAGPGVPEVLD